MNTTPQPGVPESFKVLVKELQSLCLDVRVLDKDGEVIELKDDDEDVDIRFAKIVTGADGEEEYVEPTDEEFEAVCEVYNSLWEDEDEENT